MARWAVSASASDASTEPKAACVRACRTIIAALDADIAALDTEPGKPLVLPGTPSASPSTARPSLDQVLDMMSAKPTLIAAAACGVAATWP